MLGATLSRRNDSGSGFWQREMSGGVAIQAAQRWRENVL